MNSTSLKVTHAREHVDGLRLQVELQADVARAVTAEAETLEDLLLPAVQAVATTLDAEVVAIWTTSPESGELCLETSASVEGAPTPRPRAAIGEAYVTALSTAARPSVFIDPPFEQPLFTVGLGGNRRGTSVCPLVLDGNRLVGVLAMVRAVPLQAGEEQAFASVADQLALAIETDRARRRMREQETGLDILIRTAPDGIVVMDARNCIIGTNHSLDQIFGYEAGELIGQEITALMPERLRARHNAGMRRYQDTGEKRISWHSIELVGLRKDGTEFPIEVSFGEYAQDGRRVFTGFMRDITDRKRAEARDRRRRRMIQTAAVYLGSSWVALEAADLLIPVLPLPQWTFRALLLIGLLGFPVALAFAYMFEFSKAGIRRVAPLPPAAGTAHQRRAARFMRTAALAAALVALFLVPVLIGPAARRMASDDAAVSLAVLPFQEVSAQEPRVLIGLTDEVLTQLAEIPRLRLKSRTSALVATGSAKRVGEIARELGVQYVLEGSVRRSADRMRVTVQLIHAASDEQVWSATYESAAADPLAAESAVAAQIAQTLEPALLHASR